MCIFYLASSTPVYDTFLHIENLGHWLTCLLTTQESYRSVWIALVFSLAYLWGVADPYTYRIHILELPLRPFGGERQSMDSWAWFRPSDSEHTRTLLPKHTLDLKVFSIHISTSNLHSATDWDGKIQQLFLEAIAWSQLVVFGCPQGAASLCMATAFLAVNDS